MSESDFVSPLKQVQTTKEKKPSQPTLAEDWLNQPDAEFV